MHECSGDVGEKGGGGESVDRWVYGCITSSGLMWR